MILQTRITEKPKKCDKYVNIKIKWKGLINKKCKFGHIKESFNNNVREQKFWSGKFVLVYFYLIKQLFNTANFKYFAYLFRFFSMVFICDLPTLIVS